MHAPEEYEAFKWAARRDIEEAMTELIGLMEFKKKETILDYGCGAGTTGDKFLKPLAEEYDSMVHAVDISSEMIQYAKDNYSHERVSYTQGNLLDENFPLKDVQFDRVFSAYVFHYIKDYKEALKRFYKLMKPGAQFGFSALARSAVFKMYTVIGEDPRFKKYMEGYRQFIPQWYEEKECAEHCQKCFVEAATAAGFTVKFSKVSYRKNPNADCNVMAGLFMALNPFIKSFPQDLLEELKEAYKEGLRVIYGTTRGITVAGDTLPEARHEMVTFLLEKPTA